MHQKVKIMSEVTFNSQSLTTDAVNYTNSVDKLKQAAKSHADSSGVIAITHETTAEDAKRIENYTSQINVLFAGTKTEDIQQALWANPILGNKLANLLVQCQDNNPGEIFDKNFVEEKYIKNFKESLIKINNIMINRQIDEIYRVVNLCVKSSNYNHYYKYSNPAFNYYPHMRK